MSGNEINPIRVMLFSNESTRGGAEDHILTLLRGFDRNIIQPFLACPPGLWKQLKPNLPQDVPVSQIELNSATAFSAARQLRSRLRSLRIQVLHAHLFRASIFACPVAKLCGVPVTIETPHLRESWRTGWKAGYQIDRFIGKFVDKYIAVSNANADYLRKEKRLPVDKIVVIRNGIDESRFECLQPSAALRERIGARPGERIILVPARLEPQKGHEVFLQALHSVLAAGPAVKVVFAGTGSRERELRRMAAGLGISDRVHFVGFQSNLPEWLATCDFTVLPSLFEGLPIAAIESLAAGKPMIATAVDGTPEVVLNDKTGLLVPPGDVSALADAILRLLRDPELCATLGRQGKVHVVQHFLAEQQVRATERLYLEAYNMRSRVPRPGMRPAAAQGCASPLTQSTGPAVHCSPRPQVVTEICNAAVSVLRHELGNQSTIILTGSMARREHTVCVIGGRTTIHGDTEFLVVVPQRTTLPDARCKHDLIEQITANLSEQHVHCRIDLSFVHPQYLRNLPPSIFGYELRECGEVLAGDGSVVRMIPQFEASAIPLEDAWRLLCNRIVEYVEAARMVASENPKEVAYAAVKLVLDMATSWLVFLGRYKPTYAERARQFIRAADELEQNIPCQTARFTHLLRTCTDWKLGTRRDMPDIPPNELVVLVRSLWRWETKQLLGSGSESDEASWNRLFRSQSFVTRLRGWAAAARAEGWHIALAPARWLRLAMHASPRYLVYRAANSVFFNLPLLVSADEPDKAWIGAVAGDLPVTRSESKGWRGLAADIGHNYHRFLAGTRA